MSETFNNEAEPQEPKRDAVWYKLAGNSEQALRRAIETSKNNEELPQEERRQLAEALGYFAPVIQTQCWFGPTHDYAVFPATFAHPFSSIEEFYMKCPIGSTKTEEQTHFIPDGATPLTDEEADRLEMALFPSQGASVPITERLPIQLAPIEKKTANKPPSP